MRLSRSVGATGREVVFGTKTARTLGVRITALTRNLSVSRKFRISGSYLQFLSVPRLQGLESYNGINEGSRTILTLL
jgi:hypothetical protein